MQADSAAFQAANNSSQEGSANPKSGLNTGCAGTQSRAGSVPSQGS